MQKRRRLVVLGAILGVPLVLVAILLLYFNFADLSGWRDTVAGLASDAIGRELRINGEFQPEIGFTTRVVATDITLANADWSDEPQMVSVDRLEGEIDLVSIFFGPITIPDVEISGGRVLFETGTEGDFNWALGSGDSSEESSEDSSDDGGGLVQLVIGHASLNEIQLAYKRPQGLPLEAALSKLEFTDDGTGMLDLDLAGSLKETPVEISGRLGTFIGLINAGAVEHDLTGRFAGAEVSLRGTIDDLGSLTGVESNASASGSELSQIISSFGIDPLIDGPFTVEASVKKAASGSDFNLDAAAGGMSAHITGVVDSLTEPSSLDATVTASGSSIRAVGILTGIANLPDEGFSVSGGVRWEGFPIHFKQVKITVGDNSLSADGVLGAPPQMLGTDFTIQGDGPNVSSIGALAGIDLPRDEYSIGGRVVRVEGGLQVENVEAHIGRTTLEVDGTIGDPPEYDGTALNIRGSGPNLAQLQDLAGVALPAEPFEVNGKLTQGVGAINIEAVRARFGRNTLQISGQLVTQTGLVGTDVRLNAKGPDASQLAAIAAVTGVPAEPFTAQGRVRVLDRGYRVTNLVGSLGTLGMTVDGFVAPPPTLIGSDLQIHVEDSDLSHPASVAGLTGLPHDAFKIDTRLRVEDPGYRLDDFTATIGDMELEAAGLIGAPPELEGTEIQFTARGSKLASLNRYVDQIGIPPVPFSVSGRAKITNGAYVLDDVFAEVDGTRATLYGTIHPTNGLVGTDLDLELSAPDLGRTGQLAAGFVDLPVLPSEPFTLKSRLGIDEDGYNIQGLQFSLADATAAVDGRVGALPDIFGTDLRFNVDGPTASLFNAISGVTVPVAPFKLTGRVERNTAGFRFHEIVVRLGEYRAAIDGSLGELPKLIGTDLEIHASGPGTGLIKELAGLPRLPDKPFKLDGAFSGTPERFAARDFSLTFGPNDLTGSFTIDITGKPNVHARLTSTHFDIRSLLERAEKTDTASEDAPEAAPQTSVKRTQLISDEPFDLALLQKADADVVVRIDEIVLLTNRLHDVSVDLLLKDGRLEIERMTAVGLDQGSASGNLVLEPIGDQHRLRAQLKMLQIHLDLPGTAVDPNDKPPVDIDIDIEARGATPHELASSSNGSVQVVIGKGVMDNRALDLVSADILLTLLTAFNPFAKEDAATELECAVVQVTLENGLARLEPMAFQSDKMTMVGNGRIDFGTENLDLNWVTKPRKGIGLSASMITNPYIKLGGTLADPAIEVKPMQAVASTGVAVATMGLSLLAKGMYDRVTAEKKVCKNALKEIGRRADGSTKKSKKKK